jgi:hypothetical protein
MCVREREREREREGGREGGRVSTFSALIEFYVRRYRTDGKIFTYVPDTECRVNISMLATDISCNKDI